MNIDTYLAYLRRKRYDLYNHWENEENELKNRIDLLISYYQKELSTENSELKAKVYTYEKIIANSNFKTILSKDKQTLEKRIKELEEQIEENK